MLKPLLEKLIARENLSTNDMTMVVEAIVKQTDTPQIAAFLALLKAKGETAEEIAALAFEIRQLALSVHVSYPVLDIVGTGGDHTNTVNISTGSAILAAACGIPVAKHGNRAVSSQCGSADVLEALGINIEMHPQQVSDCIEQVGIGFMLAPLYHPSLRFVGGVRRALKIPTVFNLLGPLLNPTSAKYLLFGVYHSGLVPLMARVLQTLKVERALVFHGHGTDELTPIASTLAMEVTPQQIKEVLIDPVACGLAKCQLADLKGGNAQHNAALLQHAFKGNPGAISDTLALNAGTALWIYGKAKTVCEGVLQAQEVLQSGEAERILQKWKAMP